MHSPQILDKHGHQISIGDTVYTPFRGGKHEGRVEALITNSSSSESQIQTAPGDNESLAAAEKTINPPKVLFHDQKDRQKEHRPQALANISQDTEREMEKDMRRPIGQRPTASVHQRSKELKTREDMSEEEYERLDGTTKELMEPESEDERILEEGREEMARRSAQGGEVL